MKSSNKSPNKSQRTMEHLKSQESFKQQLDDRENQGQV